jgi:hypothetical protein
MADAPGEVVIVEGVLTAPVLSDHVDFAAPVPSGGPQRQRTTL